MNIRIHPLCLSGFLALWALCPGASQAESVYASDGGKTWKSWKVETVHPAAGPDVVNRFGGSTNHRVAAPGYFRVIKRATRWWMIDPDGCLFFSIGMNSVEPERVGRTDKQAWAEETHALLKGAGFNTLGRWSDPQAFADHAQPMPWCSTLTFMKTYAGRKRAEVNGERGFPNETIPVFDKEWPGFCEDYAAKNVAATVDDPWLLGHFSDNELPFRPDALTNYLELPATDAGHQAAKAWIRKSNVRPDQVDRPDIQAAFLEVVSRLYFETVAASLKKADPNHLYIGSRLHGRCIREPVLKGAAACDIVTINYYHRWVPEQDRAGDWTRWSGRPFMATEFYAMKVADEQTESEGAGFRVLNHAAAAAFYHTFTAGLLQDIPGCVGWHWFKYADDTPEWQKGIVGNDGSPHAPLVEGMKIVNQQAYSLRGL